MATIHDLIEVTSIREHTTYSDADGNLLGVVDGASSSAFNDGEFDVGDGLWIEGTYYRIDKVQEPTSSGRFLQGDGTNRSFDPGDEDDLDVVFLTVSSGGTQRFFVIPNDSYGDMNVQAIRTGEIGDADGSDAGVISTTNNDVRIVCFAAGTLIATKTGEVPVEALRPGDMVWTLDNGFQPLAWSAMRHLGPDALAAAPQARPVRIAAGAFGNDRPLVVSPQHGLLLTLGGSEILARAIHLARLKGGSVRHCVGCQRVSYVHLFFERHQVVLSNGIPSESLYPGAWALSSLAPEARLGLSAHLPRLGRTDDPSAAGSAYGPSVRAYSRTSLLPGHLHAFRAAA